ncbi:MAG: Ig-like domain-containing protein [Eubacteriales bacterium]|nr:Ig-like domain-containing protein [Eubacteriales bacterium]
MKRILAFILSLILLFQVIIPVSAKTTVVSDSAPDYDIWMSDTLIQGLNGAGGLYKTFRQSQEPVSIKLNKTSVTLKVGESVSIKATVTGKANKVTWKSTNTSVATVNSKGKITAKAKGTTTIKATANGVKTTCKIIVKNVDKKEKARKAYKTLISQYEKKYGIAKFGYIRGNYYWTGLCFCKLFDFNNDGIEELVLVYQSEKSNKDKIQYHVEFWTHDGKRLNNIISTISWSGNNSPLFGFVSFVKYKGKTYLHISPDPMFKDYYYGKKSTGNLGLVHKFEWKGDMIKGQWYYNGKRITVAKHSELFNSLSASSTGYGFSSLEHKSKIEEQIRKTKNVLNLP